MGIMFPSRLARKLIFGTLANITNLEYSWSAFKICDFSLLPTYFISVLICLSSCQPAMLLVYTGEIIILSDVPQA